MYFGVFAANVGFILTALLVLGGCGWAVVAPFRDRLKYPLMVAPMAGLLCLLPATLGLYAVLNLPLVAAGVAAGGALLGTGAIYWLLDRPVFSWRAATVPVVTGVWVTGLAVFFLLAITVKTGSQSLIYWDGTDHLGYTHVADWMVAHPIRQMPLADAARPYESWPAIMFQFDARFGCFAYVGLVSAASGQPGMFSYDLACALAYVLGILAVTGLFARSPLTVALLVIGLFTSHWFDYSRTGFLGKTLGYPATFAVVGLVMVALSETEIRMSRLIVLISLTVGASIALAGAVTALFLTVIVGGFLLAQAVAEAGPGFASRLPALLRKGLVLVVLAIIAVAASGLLARPQPSGPPDWGVSWSYIYPRIAELESQGVPFSGFSPAALTAATWTMFAAWLFLGVLAVAARSREACALLLAPMAFLLVLRVANAGAVTFQLIGFFYPLALAGAAVLVRALREPAASASRFFTAPATRWVLAAVCALVVGLHQFRFSGAVGRYGGSQTPPKAIFTQTEMEALVKFVGTDPVEVDVTFPQQVIALLVELGRRPTQVQWTPAAWKAILAYRGWPPPQYTTAAKWRIVSADTPDVAPEQVALRGAQFWVLKR